MKRYDNIQVLRVLACLGVFITHLAPRMGAKGRLAEAANFCASGVYLFFLISGFLACKAGELSPGSGRRSVPVYWCRRFFRILPLYYAVILYNMLLHGLILRDVPPDPGGLYWLRYFFLTNAFIPGPNNFWSNLSATWTVSLFAFFYLCAPLLVRLIGENEVKWSLAARAQEGTGRQERGAGRKRASTRTGAAASDCAAGQMRTGRAGVRNSAAAPNRAVWRAAFLYLAALLLRIVWVAAGLSSYMMAFYYLHFFVLGMLVRELADAYRPAEAAGRFGVFAAALGLVLQVSGAGNDYFTVISWFFALAVLATGNFSWKRETASGGADTAQRPGRRFFRRSEESAESVARPRGSAGEIMRVKGRLPGRIRRVTETLDTYSYAIYLVHAAVIDGIALLQAHITLPGWAVLVLAVALTWPGAYLAHRLIEVPGARLGTRLSARIGRKGA